jgi:hypothetical protein
VANTCKTCKHPALKEINGLLINEISFRNIVKQWDGLTVAGVRRHKENCIEALFAEKREETRAGLLADVDELKEEIRQTRIDFIDNPQARVQLIARRKEAIELEAKLTGAFIKDAENPADLSTLADVVKRYRADVIEQARIFEGTNGKFGAAMPTEAEMRVEIERLCRHQKVDPLKLDAFVTQQELGRVD